MPRSHNESGEHLVPPWDVWPLHGKAGEHTAACMPCAVPGLGRLGLIMLGVSTERAAVSHGAALGCSIERAAVQHGAAIERGIERGA